MLCGGWIREPEMRIGQLLVGHGFLDVSLEGVDPTVADTVGKLLLLAPGHAFRKVLLECLAQDPFLNPPLSLSSCLSD